jgi:hypothetical protein
MDRKKWEEGEKDNIPSEKKILLFSRDSKCLTVLCPERVLSILNSRSRINSPSRKRKKQRTH